MDLSEAARLLGQQPKPKRYRRICPVCGKEFMTTRKGRFCSDACRYRHYNATRRKDKRAASVQPGSKGNEHGT